jgi:hypothetical protein
VARALRKINKGAGAGSGGARGEGINKQAPSSSPKKKQKVSSEIARDDEDDDCLDFVGVRQGELLLPAYKVAGPKRVGFEFLVLLQTGLPPVQP